jgi:hypothetical protein
MDVEHRRDGCWKRIVDEKIAIPAHSIKLYDSDGKKTGRLLYGNRTVTLNYSDSFEIATTDAEEFHNMCAPETSINDPQVSCDALTSTPSLVSEDTQGGEQSSMEEASAAGQTHTEVSDVFVDEGTETSTANTAPLSNAVAGISSSNPSTGSFINLNLEEHNEGLKTSVCNGIKRLLGCDDDLIKFDDLRSTLKRAQRVGNHVHIKTDMSEYKKMVRNMKTKVKLVESERAAKVKELEQKHFQQNGKLPPKTPGTDYYKILKERILATNILRFM